MGMLDGKVAFITGAARGQGRAHAVRMAAEGADIIAADLCGQIDSVPYPMGSHEELATTVRLVESKGRRVYAAPCDVRSREALEHELNRGCELLGPVSVAVANAGIWTMAPDDLGQQPWYDSIDVMLTGAYHTVDVVGRHMVANETPGSIVITSSAAGLVGLGRGIPFEASNPGFVGYIAAKAGVVGVMRHYAGLLAPYRIRVNSIHPTGVNTPMIHHEAMEAFGAAFPVMAASFGNALPLDVIEPEDVAATVAWLCSDEAHHITGVVLPVDAGHLLK